MSDKRTVWERLPGWFASRGWKALPFQTATWAAYRRGESGLLHMPTGAGKTYAAYFGPLAAIAERPEANLQIIYVTPLRALARDIEKALAAPVLELGLPLRVESRTGDTSSYRRAKQKTKKPNILVTTPESLSLLLSYATAPQDFAKLEAVIVDEWHELLGNKRGSLLELALSRVRKFSPDVKTWALSATLKNVEEAAIAAVGTGTRPTIVNHPMEREIEIDSILPAQVDSFPWAGHLGLKMLPAVLESLTLDHSTILFTNTRSQAERWFEALREARPEWNEFLGLHHGSLSIKERARIEDGLKTGGIKIVVATSSLDLGVDLTPVERVFQIGSPKGIGRLIQRAGRSGHSPGKRGRIVFVPTHALELVEIAAARDCVRRGDIEARIPPNKPLDVLAQHLVTCALGGGFTKEEMAAELATTSAFATLSEAELDWTLALVRDGGKTLAAYPGYHKIKEVDGRFAVPDARIARMHRLNVGTILSDANIVVKLMNGKLLGSIEEAYVGRLKKGDRFLFAGRLLELVMLRDMAAWVRLPKRNSDKTSQTPHWMGSRMPLSTSLAAAVREKFQEAHDGQAKDREIIKAWPIMAAQQKLSRLPVNGELLAETCLTREGYHLFLYPFEGRLVHEGLAALLAFRLSRYRRGTFSLAVNDYGLELLSPSEFPFREALEMIDPFSADRLLQDTQDSCNLTELERRQFREIARVSGLVVQNMGGSEKTSRQLQVSSSLLFDVFKRYDPENLLLLQAQREVLEKQFEAGRLGGLLDRLRRSRLVIEEVRHPTPLAFPLVVSRMGARLSTETMLDRIERMKAQWTRDDDRKSRSKGKKSLSYQNVVFIGQPEKRS